MLDRILQPELGPESLARSLERQDLRAKKDRDGRGAAPRPWCLFLGL
jgi:hypothetical protein